VAPVMAPGAPERADPSSAPLAPRACVNAVPNDLRLFVRLRGRAGWVLTRAAAENDATYLLEGGATPPAGREVACTVLNRRDMATARSVCGLSILRSRAPFSELVGGGGGDGAAIAGAVAVVLLEQVAPLRLCNRSRRLRAGVANVAANQRQRSEGGRGGGRDECAVRWRCGAANHLLPSPFPS
jgi:hypothetical protein